MQYKSFEQEEFHQPRTQGCLSTTLVQGENVLHFDWLIKKQCAESKILESREIIIAKTNFDPSKWQKENQNQRKYIYVYIYSIA